MACVSIALIFLISAPLVVFLFPSPLLVSLFDTSAFTLSLSNRICVILLFEV